MRKQIGYECQVEGSCTKNVEEFIARAKRTLARERAERKAKPELAKAEAAYGQAGHPARPLWRTLQALRRKLSEALEGIGQPGDEQKAREMCAQQLQGWRRSAEEHVRAALDAMRAPILAKVSFKTVCPRCKGSGEDPTSKRDDLSNIVLLVVCNQCKGTKEYRHPWFEKTIRFTRQPKVEMVTRDDGLQTIVGTWDYEVTP